jgi:hypothetical protein
MTDDLDRLLTQVGGKSYFTRDSRVGDSVTGPIVSIDVRPATDYTTKEVMHWPDGNVKEQIVVIVRAEGITPEDADDDLNRAIYVKGWGVQRSAFIEAAKAHKPEPGDRFTATFVAEKPNPKGGNPAKVYEYRITPMSASDAWLSKAADVAPADEVAEARAQAQKLIDMGTFTDAQVAAATGLPLDEVQALGNVPF